MLEPVPCPFWRAWMLEVTSKISSKLSGWRDGKSTFVWISLRATSVQFIFSTSMCCRKFSLLKLSSNCLAFGTFWCSLRKTTGNPGCSLLSRLHPTAAIAVYFDTEESADKGSRKDRGTTSLKILNFCFKAAWMFSFLHHIVWINLIVFSPRVFRSRLASFFSILKPPSLSWLTSRWYSSFLVPGTIK